ncbi:T-cell surface glycoprotein CD1e, membrane-associated-like [Ursus maritimus]|uniref:T-cell surface glycoprotein CD1e, membrane-associated-like n=1 Tax=Ursus maritimus TaxID=29073 RepID=A0A384CW73_URSMA|nr:T-cell surface glycoprotein CD1e, membrane-associated-like [Ursus maritimus]
MTAGGFGGQWFLSPVRPPSSDRAAMLLLLLLFEGLVQRGASLEASQVPGHPHPATEEPLSFRVLQTSSFANSSWASSQGSGWLGELQTHGWDNALGTISFLQPWSRGNFSAEELRNLQNLFRLYFHGFIIEVRAFEHQFQFEYPFELQVSAGCTVHAGTASGTFLNGAYQGSDFLSFQGNSWQPSPGAGSRAQKVCAVLNQYLDIKEIVQNLLSYTCPRFLAGILEAGKAELERQVKPEAWLSAGPSPGPGRLLLVCHVSGFHPKPVGVMWMRGEQEQRGTQRGDVLPHADGTWYLRVTLDVVAREAAGLSCRVKHSSLGGQDIVIHWGGRNSALLTLLCLVVIVTLLVLLVGHSCFKKHSSNQKALAPAVHGPDSPTGADTQGPRTPGHQLYLPQESWIKNRFLKKWKTSLNQLWGR